MKKQANKLISGWADKSTKSMIIDYKYHKSMR